MEHNITLITAEDELVSKTCSQECFGVKGYHGSCCTLEQRDYIIGPIDDTDAFLQRLEQRFGRPFAYGQVFIDFVEGRQRFPARTTWQDPNHYPALRVNFVDPLFQCTFYNKDLRVCSVHDIRPQKCKDYFCPYLKDLLNKE